MSNAWSSAGNACTVAAKGAPETIGMLCHMSADELAELRERVDALAIGIGRVIEVFN